MSLKPEERISFLKKSADDAISLRRTLIEDHLKSISDLAARMAAVIGGGRKILVCGNGGSAADSSHLVTELVVRLAASRNRTALPAISLAADSAVLTASANDFGFDQVFARQVEALGGAGDMLLLLSTSGKSSNLLRAAETAIKRKLVVCALLGADGGDLLEFVEESVIVPSDSTQRIQEEQKFIIHALVELIESDLFG
ncbi:MAG: SIS domain-containing protein [candidate division Zixibacteria bacterium]|nr:SIS domain-containing protein [candidate division Zixibacteria bacterium]